MLWERMKTPTLRTACERSEKGPNNILSCGYSLMRDVNGVGQLAVKHNASLHETPTGCGEDPLAEMTQVGGLAS